MLDFNCAKQQQQENPANISFIDVFKKCLQDANICALTDSSSGFYSCQSRKSDRITTACIEYGYNVVKMLIKIFNI